MKPWKEVVSSEEFQGLSEEERVQARDYYFEKTAAALPPEEKQIARQYFTERTDPSMESSNMAERVGKGLALGVAQDVVASVPKAVAVAQTGAMQGYNKATSAAELYPERVAKDIAGIIPRDQKKFERLVQYFNENPQLSPEDRVNIVKKRQGLVNRTSPDGSASTWVPDLSRSHTRTAIAPMEYGIALEVAESGSLSPENQALLQERWATALDGQADATIAYENEKGRVAMEEQRFADGITSPEDRAMYKVGENISEAAEETFVLSPEDQQKTSTQVGRGLGQVGGMIAAGTLGAAGRTLATLSGMSMTGMEGFDDARQHGADDETAVQSGAFGFGVGTSEMLPIEPLINKIVGKRAPDAVKEQATTILKKVLDKTKQVAVAGGVSGGEEFLQEVSQQLALNYNAAKIQRYDEDRELTEGTAAAGEMAFTVGGITGALVEGLTRGRSRGADTNADTQPAPQSAPLQEEALSPEELASDDLPEGIEVNAAPAAPLEAAQDIMPAQEQPPLVSEATPAPAPAPAPAAELEQVLNEERPVADIVTENDAVGEGFILVEAAENAQAAPDSKVYYNPATGEIREIGEGADKAVVKQPLTTETDPVVAAASQEIARQETAAPSDAQKESGNYKKGALKIHDLNVKIETAKGQERSGQDADGNSWAVAMPADYGYITRTKGADKEEVDVYVGDSPTSDTAFVVDQFDPSTGRFDEHKVMMGFASQEEAMQAYNAAFDDGSGPSRAVGVSPLNVAELKDWLKGGNSTAPFSETARQADADTVTLAAKRNSVPREDGTFSLGPISGNGNRAKYERYSPLTQQELRFIDVINDEIQGFQTGYRMTIEADGQGSTGETIGVKSESPQWFKDLKVTRKQVETALNKAKAHKPLSIVEARIVDSVTAEIRSLREENVRQYDQVRQSRPYDNALRVADKYGIPHSGSADASLIAEMVLIADNLEANGQVEAAGEVSHAIDAVLEVDHALVKTTYIEEAGLAAADNIPFFEDEVAALPQQNEPAWGLSDDGNQPSGQSEVSPPAQQGAGQSGGSGIQPQQEERASEPQSEREQAGGNNQPSNPIQEVITTETTPEGEQAVVPGAERITEREQAERGMEGRKKPKKPQADIDVGLFDTGARSQGDLLDIAARKEPEAPAPAPTQPSKNQNPVKKLSPKKRAENKRKAVDAYYTPGNVIKSYGNEYDKVIAFERTPDAFIVTVQASDKDGVVKEGTRTRRHGTTPEMRDLRAAGLLDAAGAYTGPDLLKSTQSNEKPEEVAEKPAEKDLLKSTDVNDTNVVETKKTSKKQSKPTEVIDDFGEKIGGARKDVWSSFQTAVGDSLPEDMQGVTLSKYFPEPDYDKLRAEGVSDDVLLTIKALRDILPAKPRKPYKLKEWLSAFKSSRAMANGLLKGTLKPEDILSPVDGKRSSFELAERIRLYQELGYPLYTKAKEWKITTGSYSYFNGERHNPPITRYTVERVKGGFSRGPYFEQKADAIAKLKAMLEKDEGTTKKVKLNVYKVTATGDIVIGKKVGSGKFIDLKTGFKTAMEAYKYIDANEDSLIELLEKKKDLTPMRRSTNDPRVGEDYRKGKDITAEAFGKEFDFRGVEFGNYVEQTKRQDDLNNAYDALKDMSTLLGIPTEAIGLEGTLGLAFGARGKGGKNAGVAHYEPDYVAINLTKRAGAGSLAHEWWHALDHNIGRRQQGGGMLTSAPRLRKIDRQGNTIETFPIREEIVADYKAIVDALNSSAMKSRSKERDNTRSSDYWSTNIEMTARAFEAYLINKMMDKKQSNDYLANIEREDVYEAIGDSTYPYPTAAEMDILRPLFDKLFKTMKSKKTDKGVQLYRRDEAPKAEAQTQELKALKVNWNDNKKKVAGRVKRALRQTFGENLNLRFVDELITRDDGQNISGVFSQVQLDAGVENTIIIALEGKSEKELMATLSHEGVHFLRRTGALDGHWRHLRKMAEQEWIKRFDIDRLYKGADDALKVEEAIAEAYASWSKGELEPVSGIAKLFSKVQAFFRKLGSMLKNDGFTDYTSVFSAIDKGRMKSSASRSEPGTAFQKTDGFKKWFEGSQVVNKDGSPLVVYHGTKADFDTFRRVSHFGSKESANNRLSDSFNKGGENIVPVYLSIKNPVRIEDSGRNHTAEDLAIELENLDILTKEETDYIVNKSWERLTYVTDSTIEAKTRSALIEKMEEKGYDGFVYKNAIEDTGKDSWIALKPEQVKSAISNSGAYSANESSMVLQVSDPKQEDAFEQSGLNFGLNSTGIFDRLGEDNQSSMQKFRNLGKGEDWGVTIDELRRNVQDRFIGWRRVLQSIEEASGGEISIGHDVYLQEELFTGRVGDDLLDLEKTHQEPLLDAIHDITRNTKVTYNGVEDYLYAKHAKERNARIAKINPKFPDGGSGMTNAEADAILKKAAEDGTKDKLENIYNKMRAMLDESLKRRYELGLIDKQTYLEWSAMKTYMPLRGRGEIGLDDNNDFGNFGGKGFNVKGAESKQALGRKSKATDIISHSFTIAQESIIRSHKNKVGESLYELVTKYPNKDLWEVNRVEEKAVLNRATGLVEYRTDIPRGMIEDEKTLYIKIKGKAHRVTIHDYRLAAPMKNLEANKLNVMLRSLMSIGHFLSMTRTTLSPEFLISNGLRDLETAAVNLQEYEGQYKGLMKASVKDYWRALRASFGGVRGKEDTEWEKYFKEYSRSGGRVSFWKMDDIREHQKNIKKELRIRDSGVVPVSKRSIKATYTFIENVNLAVENAMRLSAFVNARRMGMPEEKAASLAKNLTVNFNRRGELGPTLNSFYLFFNASTQGIARIARALKTKRVQKVAGAIMVAGLMADLINSITSPEDEDGELIYDKIPTWEKESNLIIMDPWGTLGKGVPEAWRGEIDNIQYVKIPLFYGYRWFHEIGRNVGATSRGAQGVGEGMVNTMTSLFNNFNPIGGSESIVNFFAPTFADPFIDMGFNRDFSGRNIKPQQNQYDPAPDPDSEQFYPSVNSWSRWVTKNLNEITGGNEFRPGWADVSPEYLDYMGAWLTGSAGAFVGRTVNALDKGVLKGEELTINQIPFARKLVGGHSYWLDRSNMYDRISEIMAVRKEYVGFNDSGKDGEAKKVEARGRDGALLPLIGMAKQAQKRMRVLRRVRIAITNDESMSKEQKKKELEALLQEEKTLVTNFNRRFVKAVKETAADTRPFGLGSGDNDK